MWDTWEGKSNRANHLCALRLGFPEGSLSLGSTRPRAKSRYFHVGRLAALKTEPAAGPPVQGSPNFLVVRIKTTMHLTLHGCPWWAFGWARAPSCGFPCLNGPSVYPCGRRGLPRLDGFSLPSLDLFPIPSLSCLQPRPENLSHCSLAFFYADLGTQTLGACKPSRCPCRHGPAAL